MQPADYPEPYTRVRLTHYTGTEDPLPDFTVTGIVSALPGDGGELEIHLDLHPPVTTPAGTRVHKRGDDDFLAIRAEQLNAWRVEDPTERHNDEFDDGENDGDENDGEVIDVEIVDHDPTLALGFPLPPITRTSSRLFEDDAEDRYADRMASFARLLAQLREEHRQAVELMIADHLPGNEPQRPTAALLLGHSQACLEAARRAVNGEDTPGVNSLEAVPLQILPGGAWPCPQAEDPPQD